MNGLFFDNGQGKVNYPTSKGFWNLDFKLASWWVTHRQDDVDSVSDRRQVPSSQGNPTTNQTNASKVDLPILQLWF